MNAIFVDAERQREFDRSGYTVARLFSEEQARAFEAEIQAFAAADGFASNADSANTYHASYFDESRENRLRAYGFARRALAGPVAALLRGYRMVSGALVVKRPGDGAVPLHRDWTLTADPRDVTLNCWCPLIDADEANGTLRLVVGSHRLVPNIETAHVTPYFSAYGRALAANAAAVPVKAGEALIFDSGALHWSDGNRSDAARAAILSTWIPEQSRAVFYALDRTSGGNRFELFDMEDGGLVEHRPSDLAARAFSRPSLGFVPNPNRAVPEEEFMRRLAQGATLRRAEAPPPARQSALAWFRDRMLAKD